MCLASAPLVFWPLLFAAAVAVCSPSNAEQQQQNGGELCQFIGELFATNPVANTTNQQNDNSQQGNAGGPVRQVVRLVSQRLDLARPVALYKWQNNQQIDDPVREASLLASVASQANASGLSVPFAQLFFKDQINASKVVQFAYFALWQSDGAPDEVAPDLATVTRALINSVTTALVQSLALVPGNLGLTCHQQRAEGLVRLFLGKQITTNSEAARPRALCTGLANLCGGQTGI